MSKSQYVYNNLYYTTFVILGGWTLLKRTTIPANLSDFSTKKRTLATDYTSISNYLDNFLFVSKGGIEDLRQAIQFYQLRWYCYKKNQGSVFHVMTKNNSAGHSVLDYFLKNPNNPAAACDSFDPLPNDNSTLSQNCAEWGDDRKNKWGHSSHHGKWRLYRSVSTWIAESQSFSLRPQSELWCDDKGNSAPILQGNAWEIYAR